jgi:hypothetical protein
MEPLPFLPPRLVRRRRCEFSFVKLCERDFGQGDVLSFLFLIVFFIFEPMVARLVRCAINLACLLLRRKFYEGALSCRILCR